MQRITPTTAFAATALLTLLGGAAVTTSASAQTRAALVQDVDAPARSPYQEHVFGETNNGPTAKTNVAKYSAVPPGMRLVVTHVSGLVDTVFGTLPTAQLASDLGSQLSALEFVPAIRGTTNTATTRIVVNADVLAYFGPGETPSFTWFMNLTSDTFIVGSGIVTLTGYYIKLP